MMDTISSVFLVPPPIPTLRTIIYQHWINASRKLKKSRWQLDLVKDA